MPSVSQLGYVGIGISEATQLLESCQGRCSAFRCIRGEFGVVG